VLNLPLGSHALGVAGRHAAGGAAREAELGVGDPLADWRDVLRVRRAMWSGLRRAPNDAESLFASLDDAVRRWLRRSGA
jgi:hypothetical protein